MFVMSWCLSLSQSCVSGERERLDWASAPSCLIPRIVFLRVNDRRSGLAPWTAG